MRRRFLTRALATAVAVVAFGVTAGASSAAASGDFDLAFGGQTSLTIEYGESWFFELRGDVTEPCECESKVTLLNGATGKVIGAMPTSVDDVPIVIPLYSQVFNLAPMPAGKHSFTARIERLGAVSGGTAQTDVPAQLTVTPAKLGSILTVTPDPANPSNVILSAALTGRFVAELDYFQDPVSAPMPAGTWTFTGTDDTGKVVYESRLVQDAGVRSSASKYWLTPPPGTEFVVEASFVPDTAAAGNFAITQPETTTFTIPAPDEEAAPAVPTPGDGVDQEEGGPTGPSLPAWAVWLYSIALLTLIAATAFIIVRSRRASPATRETVSA
ncbi:hypothetical protein EYE40_03810 [Glaciihabitans arcticus]|uniref:Uncharacterized protein n=1 Tax=Glaciihabitans arcticus TaxID=2668039 RepID=A0A4Q9GVD1_9MICO|nr:hypothetical protein [Glaciihabitans arcticus]TBN56593.1 hypothetical protein EYE40_03810 [Glaciihabitans arcticus]